MYPNTVNAYIELGLTHSIRTSERRSFRGCRRRHHWIFDQYYYPRVTPKPLEFGVAYHKAKEVLYDPTTWGNFKVAEALALTTFKQTCVEQLESFKKKNPESYTPEVQTDYDERVRLGLGMLKYYVRGVLMRAVELLTPIKVELEFEVPLAKELWCKCNSCRKRYASWLDLQVSDLSSRFDWFTWQGLPVTFGGRIDCLAQDKYGRYWIIDWKTARCLTPEGDEDFLLLDDQITGYCWALSTLGIDIAGFLYVEIRKAFPEEPVELARARKGCQFSTNKQNPTDYATFLRVIKENDYEAYKAGAYTEYLTWLLESGPRYHCRHQISRSSQELEMAGRNLYLEASEIVNPDRLIYPSPGRFSCSFCAYREPCIALNKGEDVNYLLTTMYDKRSYHYWENKAPSTESKGGE